MARYEVGTEIPVFQTQVLIDEWHKRIEEAKEEVKNLPSGAKFITFYLKHSYRGEKKGNIKILYKQTITGRHPVTDTPQYKPHWVSFVKGRLWTSNAEEIAFLDMQRDKFYRASDRELTKEEKIEKENTDLKKQLEKLNSFIENRLNKYEANEVDNKVVNENKQEDILEVKEEIQEEKKDKKVESKVKNVRGKAKGKKKNTQSIKS